MEYLLTTRSTWFRQKMRSSTQKKLHSEKAPLEEGNHLNSENRYTRHTWSRYIILIFRRSETIHRGHLSKKVPQKHQERQTWQQSILMIHSCFINRNYLTLTRESLTRNSCAKPRILSFSMTFTREGQSNIITSIMGFGVLSS